MREVTEMDFRKPEFRDAKVDEYEFRPDGKLVRKDRWQSGILAIDCILGGSRRDFEIPDLVDEVRERQKVWEIITAFIEEHQICCPETIHQTDYVIENAYALIQMLCDVVGYMEYDNGE